MTNTLPGIRHTFAHLSTGLVLLGVAGLTACANPTPGRVVEATGTSTPAIAPAASTPSTARIGGQAYRFDDGVTVNVKPLARFTPSSTAFGSKPGHVGIIVTVTVTNGTAATYDASLTQVHLSAGADGTQADAITDIERGIGGGLTGSVAPGRSLTAKYAFSVAPADLKSIAVEVVPDFTHAGVIFVGALR